MLVYKLTIRIVGRTIEVVYGIGIIKINIKIDTLHRVEVVRTPFYLGWGIRLTPKGWLYNINGFKAVRIVYERKGKNKTVMLGTLEPEYLKVYLEQFLGIKKDR